MLQIHVRTVYRLAKRGVIPGKRIGRGWRFSKRHILQMLENDDREGSTTHSEEHLK